MIINLVNLQEDEQVEVQIINNGNLFNDTIYGVEQ
jgi:antitoxin component of MazEF toxin-antitoxin module